MHTDSQVIPFIASPKICKCARRQGGAQASAAGLPRFVQGSNLKAVSGESVHISTPDKTYLLHFSSYFICRWLREGVSYLGGVYHPNYLMPPELLRGSLG